MKTALVVGASRGLGLGLVRELLSRGWAVVATVRDIRGETALREGADPARLTIERLDITQGGEIAALASRMSDRTFDLLFVNAGIANGPGETLPRSSDEAFMRILTTNALAPLRVIEALSPRVGQDGVIGAMSSQLASVAGNTSGGWELYRASKAALNTLMRSFAARRANAPWAIVCIAPGWVRTDMGGADATLDVETSMRGVADVLEQRSGSRGSAFLTYRGETLPW